MIVLLSPPRFSTPLGKLRRALILTACLVTMPATAAVSGKESSPRPWLKQKVDEARALAERKVDAGTDAETRWRTDARALINEMIDWNTMTKEALGTQWEKLTPAQQQEFSRQLKEMIEASYESKLRLALRGEVKKPKNVSIEWLDGKGVQGAETVTAKVRVDKQEALVSFRVHKVQGRWGVIDVGIDDVSTVRTYRSQFRKIITQEGFDQLLERMKRKVEDIRSGRAEIAP